MALKHALCKGGGAPIFCLGRENGLPPGKPFVALATLATSRWARGPLGLR
jgi:hypothetical protein